MDNWQKKLQIGIVHLRNNDPVLASIIDVSPLLTFSPHSQYFQELVEAIIGQQLSVKAAASILKRLKDHYGHFPSPTEIVTTDDELLRECGLSYRKISYIKDLSSLVESGQIRFENLDDMSNDEVIMSLTSVKGIGVWTAHMFLIFCMGRFDVLATGDLGIRNAVQRLYDIPHTPTPDEMWRIAGLNNWSPYESIACWYLWRSLNNEPVSA